jgi:RNA polymerase sigma-70 factor (ECF subfamily)
MKKEYSDFTEKKLISLCKKDDLKAFDELVSRNRNKVYGWILSKTKDETNAEEIFQKTLIKSWRYIKKFKGGSAYSTWANSIARNLFIDDYRKAQRKKEESLEEAMIGGKCWADHAQLAGYRKIEQRELLSSIKKVLSKLSENHREILENYYFQDMSYKDIAIKTNCSIGTVMSRLFYAKKRAQKILKTMTEFK